jgi:hypothetical protein
MVAMRHLKIWFIALLLVLTVFFNIHRVNIGDASEVGMDWFIYPLAFGAVLSIFLIPAFVHVPRLYLLAFWLAVYMALKLLVLNAQPFVGQVYTYLTLTEVTFLSLLVVLAHGAARAIHEFLKAVEFVTLAEGSSEIPSLEESIDSIHAEINRSRHNNRAFSVILASLEPEEIQPVLPRLVLEAQQRIIGNYINVRLAQTLRSELRRMDIVLEDRKKGRVVIVSPEVDEMGAAALLGRLAASVGEKFGVSMKCGSASYPNRALTFEDLVHAAEQELRQEPYFQFSDSTGVAD